MDLDGKTIESWCAFMQNMFSPNSLVDICFLMFCMKAHQLSIVLPSKSRLVQLRMYTSYTKTCFFLGFQNDLLLVICTIQMLWFYSIFKWSSEKYTTDIKCIYYTNRTYLFGSILVYGSLLFLSRTKYCSLNYAEKLFKHRHLRVRYSLTSWWEYTF
jgi:hypothetical protein